MNLTNLLAFLQGPELIIIMILVLLFFGGAKIPQLMRGLGRGMGEFQTGVSEGKKKMEETLRASHDEDDADKK